MTYLECKEYDEEASHAHAHARTRSHTHTHTLTPTHTHTLTHSRTHARTHAHTHKHTLTHSQEGSPRYLTYLECKEYDEEAYRRDMRASFPYLLEVFIFISLEPRVE